MTVFDVINVKTISVSYLQSITDDCEPDATQRRGAHVMLLYHQVKGSNSDEVPSSCDMDKAVTHVVVRASITNAGVQASYTIYATGREFSELQGRWTCMLL